MKLITIGMVGARWATQLHMRALDLVREIHIRRECIVTKRLCRVGAAKQRYIDLRNLVTFVPSAAKKAVRKMSGAKRI